MNIKSLLLGSAAALVAVSGARAADAVVVAEPEPAEYVRICDIYGAGYFYIPGTETCMRIGASMRYTIGIGDLYGYQNVRDVKSRDPGATPKYNDTYSKNANMRMQVWTGQETELGTLQTYIRFDLNYGSGAVVYNGDYYEGGDYRNGQLGTTTQFAYMQLGGFLVGITESAFSNFPGYAGNVVNDTLIGYGSFTTGAVQYHFDGGNGFSGVISLEEGSSYQTIDSYVPHVVAGAKWTQGWGGISGVLGYDSNLESITGKVRLDVKVNDQFSLWAMAGYGSDKDEHAAHDWFKVWDGHWAVWGGGAFQFNEKGSINAQLSYESAKTFAATVNVDYQPVKDFHVIPEVSYVNHTANNAYGSKGDAWGATLRFQRDF